MAGSSGSASGRCSISKSVTPPVPEFATLSVRSRTVSPSRALLEARELVEVARDESDRADAQRRRLAKVGSAEGLGASIRLISAFETLAGKAACSKILRSEPE